MRIIYDADSTTITRNIEITLYDAGYFDAAQSVQAKLSVIEFDISNTLNQARSLLNENNIEATIQLLFANPAFPDGLHDDGKMYLKMYRNNPKLRGRQFKEVLGMVINQIEEQDFQPTIPLNLLAALDVLFHQIVIARRCFEAAANTFRSVLNVELNIVDDQGESVMGPLVDRQMSEAVQLFWIFFDDVLAEWQLDSLRESIIGFTQESSGAKSLVLNNIAQAGSEIIKRLSNERYAA